MRITKVTTKIGDKGQTQLSDGTLVSKSTIRIRSIGSIDELNSHIGMLIVMLTDADLSSELNQIQNDLFNLGGEISDPNSEIQLLDENAITFLTNQTNEMNAAICLSRPISICNLLHLF